MARIERARERAEAERARAGRASDVARRHEALSETANDSMRPFHERMATLHRRIQERHLTALRMHLTHAERLRLWAVEPLRPDVDPPRFIAAVADTLGTPSVGVTVLGADGTELFVAVSDPMAAAAHELEIGLSEGPVHDATIDRKTVTAALDPSSDRWPHYAPALAALGVRSVSAAPLCVAGRCFGALAAYDPIADSMPSDPASAVERLRLTADALIHTVLLGKAGDELLDESTGLPLFEDADHLAVLHQAVGMVSEQCRCHLDDALALIQARAFSNSANILSVAHEIVAGRLRFGEREGSGTE